MLRIRAVAEQLRAEQDETTSSGPSVDDGLYVGDRAGSRNPANQLSDSDFAEPGILIKITNTDPSSMSAQELYDRVRGDWRISPARARNAELAFGVFDGSIVEVYGIDEWFPVDQESGQEDAQTSENVRYRFVGHLASDELREHYKGRFVTNLFRGQNPIRYVGGA